jgi:hypothetical protein
MKLGIPALLLLLTVPATGRAAETPHDVETDHIDAFDDGGPRTFGLLTNPAGMLLGVFGAEGDLVLGDTAAVSAEADLLAFGGATAYAAALGLPMYPMRVPFHGFVVHPRVSLARATSEGATVDLAGVIATLGWQWTLPAGLSMRVGAGVRFDRAIGGDPDAGAALEGLHPVADGSVGWVF